MPTNSPPRDSPTPPNTKSPSPDPSMSPHIGPGSVLFSPVTVVDPPASPALSIQSSRRSSLGSSSGAGILHRTYWAEDHHSQHQHAHGLPATQSTRIGGRDYAYTQYTSASLENTSIPSGRGSNGRHNSDSPASAGPNPAIDFSSLIPMYPEPPQSPDVDSRGGGSMMDLSYSPDWPTASLSAAPYAPPPYPRPGNKSGLWHPSSDPHHHGGAGPSSPYPTYGGGGGSGSGGGGASNLLIQHFNEYIPSSPYSTGTNTSSSTPSPSYFLTSMPPPTTGPFPSALSLPSSSHPHPHPHSPHSSSNSSANSRRRGPAPLATPDGAPAKKSCFHCHVTSTPLWRRDPATQRPLCNACGLYLQQRNKLRPQELIDADIDDDDGVPQVPDEEYTGPRCSHCNTRQTSVWRRSKTGAQVCNACGVYARLRGKERPLSLRRNKIKPRTKHGSSAGAGR
ncbi:GATA zinc finger domain-containing protein [Favolaschia claudopus]|uniref:GATA zinc finger domain-containing protein n=1 Tax=Favolaschia claudopus TaxID=2862362 RepID=A0AAW0E2X0_9AGAR